MWGCGSPLVSSVLIPPQPCCQVEGAVRGQAGVHPLRQVEDLGRRESLPVPFLPLQPALAAAGRSLVPASDVSVKRVSQQKIHPNSWFGLSPAAPLLPGATATVSLLQAADEEGHGHGEDDDAAHH